MKKRSGFTLVEIMIVIAVIGLLAGLASVMVMKAMKNARIKEAEVDLSKFEAGAITLADATGRWPNQAIRTDAGSVELWDLSVAAAGLLGTDGSFPNWNGPYYEGSMVDPWGNPYFFDPDYHVGSESYVVIGSFGPNGQGRNKYDDDDIYVRLDD